MSVSFSIVSSSIDVTESLESDDEDVSSSESVLASGLIRKLTCHGTVEIRVSIPFTMEGDFQSFLL